VSSTGSTAAELSKRILATSSVLEAEGKDSTPKSFRTTVFKSVDGIVSEGRYRPKISLFSWFKRRNLARGDPRVVAGAEVGSLALGRGDRWSDLDITFGITDGVAVTAILHHWSRDLVARFDAVHLFDVVREPAVYRVFLLADYLQLDVSVTPASKFRSTSPHFKLLFGEPKQAGTRPTPLSRRHVGLGGALGAPRAHMHRARALVASRVLRYAPSLPWYACVMPFRRVTAKDSIDCLPRMVTRSKVRSCDDWTVMSCCALSAGVKGLLRECELGDDDGRIRQRLPRVVWLASEVTLGPSRMRSRPKIHVGFGASTALENRSSNGVVGRASCRDGVCSQLIRLGGKELGGWHQHPETLR